METLGTVVLLHILSGVGLGTVKRQSADRPPFRVRVAQHDARLGPWDLQHLLEGAWARYQSVRLNCPGEDTSGIGMDDVHGVKGLESPLNCPPPPARNESTHGKFAHKSCMEKSFCGQKP